MGTRVRIPMRPVVAQTHVLQRKRTCRGSAGPAGECEECKKKETSLQRRTASNGPGVAPPIVHEVLRSPGEPLEADSRTFFGSRFGHDFSQVRVHTDTKAAESAKAVNANAYTVGQHVVFGPGQYAAQTIVGRCLIAHELAHVVQQCQAGTPVGIKPQLAISPGNDTTEQQADEIARRVVFSGGPMDSRLTLAESARLQRQEKSSQPPQSSQTSDVTLYPFVDEFTSVYYDVDYRHEGGNLSKWLRVNYADGTAIDLYLDEIVGQSMSPEDAQKSREQGYVGNGGRAFPTVMNPVTTPRLWAAKESALQAMEQYNLEFMTAAFPAVFFIITMPLTVMGMGTRPVATRTALTRGISGVKPTNVFDDALKAALKPNTMRHIFGKAGHGLDPLVKELGGEEQVMTEVVKVVSKSSLPDSGLFTQSVVVAGRSVTVRGAVVNGIPRVSTMFISH